MGDVYQASRAAISASNQAQSTNALVEGIGQGLGAAAQITKAWAQIRQAQNHRDVTEGLSQWTNWQNEIKPKLAEMNEQDRASFIEEEWERIESGEHPMFQGLEFRSDRGREEFVRIAGEATKAWEAEVELEAIRDLNQNIEYDTIKKAEVAAENGNYKLTQYMINQAVVEGHIDELKGMQEIDRILGGAQEDAMLEEAYEILQTEGEARALEWLRSDEARDKYSWTAMVDEDGDGNATPTQRILDDEAIVRVRDRMQGRDSDDKRIRKEFETRSHRRTWTRWEEALNTPPGEPGSLTLDMLETDVDPETGELLMDLHPDLYARYSTILADQAGSLGFELVTDDDRAREEIYRIINDREISSLREKERRIRAFVDDWQSNHMTEDGYIYNLGVSREELNSILTGMHNGDGLQSEFMETYQPFIDELQIPESQKLSLIDEALRLNSDDELTPEARRAAIEERIEVAVDRAAARAAERDEALEEGTLVEDLSMISADRSGWLAQTFGMGQEMIGVRPRDFDDFEEYIFQVNTAVRSFSPEDQAEIARLAAQPNGIEGQGPSLINHFLNEEGLTRGSARPHQVEEATQKANAVLAGRTIRNQYEQTVDHDNWMQTLDPASGQTVILDYSNVDFGNNRYAMQGFEALLEQENGRQKQLEYLLENHPEQVALVYTENNVTEYEDDNVTPKRSTLEWRARPASGGAAAIVDPANMQPLDGSGGESLTGMAKEARNRAATALGYAQNQALINSRENNGRISNETRQQLSSLRELAARPADEWTYEDIERINGLIDEVEAEFGSFE